MALNITYPTSVHVGFIIAVGWSNTYDDSYFTISRQTNNNTTWQGVPHSPDSVLTRYSEEIEATWERVRYQVSGLPSGTISTTNWITVVGGSDPGGSIDPVNPDLEGPVDPIGPELDPILSTPNILVPQSVTPNTIFYINWTDTNNTTVEYDIEESVNGGAYQRIASNWLIDSYNRTPSSEWNTVKYRVRAIGGVLTSAWGYSADILVETIFPKMSVKVGTEVRNAVDGWVMVNGTLRKMTDIWVMVNGILKKS